MGSFLNSIHVRTESYDQIRNILTELANNERYKFYLAPAINGWISIFPNNYSQIPLGAEIAKHINSNVLQLSVYDDDIFCYWYYRNGKLIDEYNSCPDYFGEEVSAKERKRLKGRPKAFKELVGDKTEIEKIGKILKIKFDVNKVQIPQDMKHEINKLKSLSKDIDNFINNPDAMNEFLMKNPELVQGEISSLTDEAKNKGIQSMEEMEKLLKESGKAQDMAMKLMEKFIKTKTSSKELDSLKSDSDKYGAADTDLEKKISVQMNMNDKRKMNLPEGLFASDTMFRFAEVLGVPNATGSYEYLKAGETSGIKEWDRFIEIS